MFWIGAIKSPTNEGLFFYPLKPDPSRDKMDPTQKTAGYKPAVVDLEGKA
jgi:hypothetical protein